MEARAGREVPGSAAAPPAERAGLLVASARAAELAGSPAAVAGAAAVVVRGRVLS